MMGEDLKDLLRALNAHAVKYLVVGGYAFGVHGEPRAAKISMCLFSRARRTARQSFVHSPSLESHWEI